MENLKKDRSQLVVKSNRLIQNTRSTFTLQQQKILLYLVSKIQPDDEEFKTYTVDLKHLCKICNIDVHPENYKNFRESIKNLRDKSFWLRTPEGYTTVSWIERFWIKEESSTLEIKFDEYLKPFLLQLRANFTAYNLEYVLLFKSAYSIRLYELLRSNLNTGKLEISLDDFRDYFMLGYKYQPYKELRRNVIEVAISEINNYTDIIISYTTERTGHKITKLIFNISKKSHVDELHASTKRLLEFDKTLQNKN